MARPDDHDRPGALSRDMPCCWCRHPHGLDTCPCGCDDHALPGIDTALGA